MGKKTRNQVSFPSAYLNQIKPQKLQRREPLQAEISKRQSGFKPEFDVKEFLTTLQGQIKQQDRSLQKDNCLQALSIAQSLSVFQSEENKVSMIKGLISFKEAMMTVRAVRWREGVYCPKCFRQNIQVISIEKDNYKYRCLDCDGESGDGGEEGDSPESFLFDDLTGLDIGKDMGSVVKWVLCMYLQSFLSVGKISKFLGINPEYAIYLIHLTNVGSKINHKNKMDNRTK